MVERQNITLLKGLWKKYKLAIGYRRILYNDYVCKMPHKFIVKRLFENSSHVIVEIKLNPLQQENTSEDFQWLYLEKVSGAFIKLWLKSQDSSPAIEERYFEQGYLKFNRNQATFIEKFNSAQYTLDRKPVDYPDNQLNILIASYLG
ncbi:hypothetical protein [Pedobacter agri]|uniref:hypothetical protein n=1 Tax=Pedobacter agri TaxID=454586 RepID=UPI00292EA7B2|nr:hypothetical protein [Pedobacter agri]